MKYLRKKANNSTFKYNGNANIKSNSLKCVDCSDTVKYFTQYFSSLSRHSGEALNTDTAIYIIPLSFNDLFFLLNCRVDSTGLWPDIFLEFRSICAGSYRSCFPSNKINGSPQYTSHIKRFDFESI